MRLRIPAWTTEEARVLLNGHAVEVVPQPGSYLNLSRSWKAGDVVELEMPMRLTREKLVDDQSMQAFLYGPVVLAGQFPMGELSFDLLHNNEDPRVKDAPIEVPALVERGANLSDWISPVAGEPLHFSGVAENGSTIELKPLNQSWQRFAVYFEVLQKVGPAKS